MTYLFLIILSFSLYLFLEINQLFNQLEYLMLVYGIEMKHAFISISKVKLAYRLASGALFSYGIILLLSRFKAGDKYEIIK